MTRLKQMLMDTQPLGLLTDARVSELNRRAEMYLKELEQHMDKWFQSWSEAYTKPTQEEVLREVLRFLQDG